MPQLTLFADFAKRENSTKRPGAGGIALDVALKEGTSLSRPTFLLNRWPDTPLPSAVNYALFAGRYYYIDDVTWTTAHMYEISCHVDVLATYRDMIASYNTFVERSASSFDDMIYDDAISQRQDISAQNIARTEIPDYSGTGGYFLRTISGAGIVGYWLNQGQMADLVTFMFDDNNFSAGGIYETLTDSTVKAFFNPFQYIVSCKWFPFTDCPGTAMPAQENIKFGWWESNVSATRVGRLVLPMWRVDDLQISMPTNQYDDFRAYTSGFSKYSVFIPGVGLTSIDAIETDSPIYVNIMVDAYTGSERVILHHGLYGSVIAELSGVCGVDVQLGQLKAADPITTATEAVSSVGGGIMSALGGNIFGGIMSAVTGTVSTVKNVLSPTPSIKGSAGNMAALATIRDILVFLENYGSAGDPVAVIGKPLYQNRRLGELSGYVKCGNASINIPGFAGEREQVSSYLNGGFYME